MVHTSRMQCSRYVVKRKKKRKKSTEKGRDPMDQSHRAENFLSVVTHSTKTQACVPDWFAFQQPLVPRFTFLPHWAFCTDSLGIHLVFGSRAETPRHKVRQCTLELSYAPFLTLPRNYKKELFPSQFLFFPRLHPQPSLPLLPDPDLP